MITRNRNCHLLNLPHPPHAFFAGSDHFGRGAEGEDGAGVGGEDGVEGSYAEHAEIRYCEGSRIEFVGFQLRRKGKG